MQASTRDGIAATLARVLAPEHLEVIDESHLHSGHHHGGTEHQAGFDGSPGTHFRVRLVAASFAGQSRLARHRAVNAALAAELAGSVHALAIEAHAPGEATRRRSAS